MDGNTPTVVLSMVLIYCCQQFQPVTYRIINFTFCLGYTI